MKFFSLFALFFGLSLYSDPVYKPLASSEIEKMRNKECVFFHVWATWCPICLEELPPIIEMLGELKKVTPVVLDLSSPFVQDNFSKKWIKMLSPPFTTFGKTDEKTKDYLNAINPEWTGGLPYSILYDRRKKKAEWKGRINISKMKETLLTHCQ